MVVPGNRNADNIDGKLAQYEHLMYPNRSMHTTGINAAMLKSFGFGQAGAEILLVHPKFLYATLGTDARSVYGRRRGQRHVQFMRSYHKMITGKAPLVNIKHRAPYTEVS